MQTSYLKPKSNFAGLMKGSHLVLELTEIIQITATRINCRLGEATFYDLLSL